MARPRFERQLERRLFVRDERRVRATAPGGARKACMALLGSLKPEVRVLVSW